MDNLLPIDFVDGKALEAFISDFLKVSRAAESSYKAAATAEEKLNDASQDILHAIELRPNWINTEEVIAKLHEIRMERRTVKNELEISDNFHRWVRDNTKAITSLSEVLGKVRRVIQRHPFDAYRFKTDIICQKDSWIQQEKEPEYEQLSLFN